MRRATLGDALRRAALRYRGKTALSFHYADGRTVHYTFDELNRATNRVANALTALGIGKGDRVAVFSHNSPEVVLLAYALLKTGAWYVPVNFMLRGEDVRTLVNFAEARMLFV
ncbi:MAG: AMP-binding protein, partial [Firmicutes bacterium]|nr:AMP-binding protein [Bacillota bacterium]